MRAESAADALLAQGQALLDAKTVLFIDDDQRQVVELHFILEQCVSADHHLCVAGDLLERGGAALALEFARQPGDLDAQGLEPAFEGDIVLLGKDLGGRHHCHLKAGFEGLQGGQCRDHGLAGTYVTLDQAQHRFGLAEIVGDLIANPLLCTSGGKPQIGQVVFRQASSLGQYRRPLCAQAFAQALLGQLVSQQLFECQAVLGPMLAFGELVEIGIGRWVMQVANGIGQRGQLVITGKLLRQPIRQAARAEHGQALLAQLPQALLGQAFGGRVDRRQGLFDRDGFFASQGAILGVIDLQPRGAWPGFAVATQVSATLEAVFLCVAEMVEAQAQHAATVAEANQQAAALAHDHVGAADHTLDHGILARAQLTDRHHAGTVLIAQWQVEQYVLEVLQPDLGQLLGHGLADPLERRDRHLRQLGHSKAYAAAGGLATEHRRIESASNSMALGRGKLARQAMATVRNGTGGVRGRTSITPGA
ncbi:hypothetical protein D9M71_292610 [compost metagenome]